MGETRVDLQHLLEDLRDAYTGAIEETILTEVVANALDSGATLIRFATNPSASTLLIVDDGRGMIRRELGRYHDVAASTKRRGEGIGFAGVGIKLGLLVSREVVTETRRGAVHVATQWHLASRHRAPWKWIPPPGFVASRGTAVQLTLSNQLSPLLDAGFVEEAVRRHFEPLLDPEFEPLLRRPYPRGIAFEVDGKPIVRDRAAVSDRVPVSIRMGRRRTPSAIGFMERHRAPLPEDRQGIAISTFGKVIRRGWDWLGISPAVRAYVTGLIEAPDLASSLTLSKNDFIRTGTRGAAYLSYRKAIQEVVSRQLAEWGDTPEPAPRPRIVRMERDLEQVLEQLADDFPLLRSLVDRRAGGQKRLPMPGRGAEQVPGPLFANMPAESDGDGHGNTAATPADQQPVDQESAAPAGEAEPGAPAEPGEPGEPAETKPENAAPEPPEPGPTEGEAPAIVGTLGTVPGRRRPARYGLLVQFESRPGDPELGRLVDSTVWINEAHPAHARAVASRSLGYHTALAVALALAPLAVDVHDEHTFVTQFLAHWGAASSGGPSRRGSRARRKKNSR